MQYFSIPTIKGAIEHLQDYRANWLLPAFVFAANDVGEQALVDMSSKLGTDLFLDRYFNGKRLHIPSFPSGNNLLRPRLKGITWDRGQFAGDHMIRQDTKMWGNLFSSRGYREMRLEGLIDGQKAITKLTDAFQPRFELEIPDTFKFEYFLVWLFAFEGFPDGILNWQGLFDHLLQDELQLASFKPAYVGRFKLADPPLPWPSVLTVRPNTEQFLQELAPKLMAFLANPESTEAGPVLVNQVSGLSADDPVYSAITAAIQSNESLAFLLAGPPGTGKTDYARKLATALTGGDDTRTLFLQFHPAIGYDDFVEGFRPVQGIDGSIKYELASRLFLNFAKLAADNPSSMYVAVIDELNRGDVARIFGEVLTYLEVDYRGLEFTLPFSGKSVALPKNLLVIATANPYDRSVTDLDDALLRRFWVIEIEPDGAVLRNHLELAAVEVNVINRTIQVFTILNQTFPNGFGHTNFLRVRSVDDLASVWISKVRLGLRRALMHDKSTFDATVVNVEALLKTKDDNSEASDASVLPGAAAGI